MSNPLRQHPFFQVANVNPDDPISVQIEQIEQLNTLLLQDIDHNFARFHDVVNNKILPQVKRYGIVSEPTREASQFWNTFFQAAAFGKTTHETRRPQDPESSTLHAGQGFHAEYDQTLDQTGDQTGSTIAPLRQHHHHNHRGVHEEDDADRDDEHDLGDETGLMTPDEHSFLYGNPIASTPLPKHHLQHLEAAEQRQYGQGRDGKLEPWAEGMSSMESPYASLERKMKEVLQNDEGMSSTGGEESYLPGEMMMPTTMNTPKARDANSNHGNAYEPYQTPEGMEEEPSVLISRTDRSTSLYHPPVGAAQGQREPSSAHKSAVLSENKELPDLPKGRTATGRLGLGFKSPKATMNPFSPARPKASSSSSSSSARPAAWDGIADLRNTPLNPKIRPSSHARTDAERTPRRGTGLQEGDTFGSDSDSDPEEAMIPGGTPPMTMNFGLPDRTIVSKTPAKEAAKAVIRNLMMDDEGMDSPGMPTPPAFSRYSAERSLGKSPSRNGGLFAQQLAERGDDTVRLERGIRGVDLGMDTDSPLMGMTEPLPPSSSSVRPDGAADPDVSTVGMPKHRRSTVPQLDFLDESFDDSLDEMPPPALPQGYVTESYGEAQQQQQQRYSRQPAGGVGQDSLALEEEEDAQEAEFTVTERQGPGQGYYAEDGTTRSEAGEIFGGAGKSGMAGKGMGGFALFGPDEMQTFHGGQLLDAAASPQDSPSYALGAKMANKRG